MVQDPQVDLEQEPTEYVEWDLDSPSCSTVYSNVDLHMHSDDDWSCKRQYSLDLAPKVILQAFVHGKRYLCCRSFSLV